MKKTPLKLQELKVKSFITSLSTTEANHLLGGIEAQIEARSKADSIALLGAKQDSIALAAKQDSIAFYLNAKQDSIAFYLGAKQDSIA